MTDTQTTPTETPAPTFPQGIALKNIKIHHGLSEETWAYTASVYLDGKRVGEVSNAGHGGPDNLSVADDKARERVRALQRQHEPGQYGEDVLFGDMLNEHMLRQEARKAFRKGYSYVVFAGASMYGFKDRASIVAHMQRDGVATYRVIEP